MKPSIVVLMLFLVFSCKKINVEDQIAASWKVHKMQREISGEFKDMDINENMMFEFNADKEVKITTHLGETISGNWKYIRENRTIKIIANKETKGFILDSVTDKFLYITSNDVKLHLKKN